MTIRKEVFNLLLRVYSSGAYSNIALDTMLKKGDYSKQDKAFGSALFYGVLERKISLDEIIKRITKGKKLDSEVKTALQMGLYQIIYMNSVPEFSAVNESVSLLKNRGQRGFVNGVLREYLRSGKDLLKNAPKWVQYSCPEWLYNKWCGDYGEENAEHIASGMLGAAPIVCRVNTTKTTEEELIKILESESVKVKKTDTENALILENISVSESEAYKNGLFHIEDISAQGACFILSPKSGETIFDLCAAPGGKSFTIAEMMGNRGKVLSFDLHEKRVGLIKSGAERLGLDIIKANVGNATEFNDKIGLADKVLCDVPCSGLGIIRRKPEIKYKNSEDFIRLPEIQLSILSNGARYVKDGGVLVYSTCTLSKAENEDVIDKFLGSHSDFTLTFSETTFPSHLRDGFYTAKLERKNRLA